MADIEAELLEEKLATLDAVHAPWAKGGRILMADQPLAGRLLIPALAPPASPTDHRGRYIQYVRQPPLSAEHVRAHGTTVCPPVCPQNRNTTSAR